MSQEDEIRTLLRRWGNAVNRLNEIDELIRAINKELDTLADVRPQQLNGMPHNTNVGRPTEENAFRRMAAEKNKISDLEEERRRCIEIVKDAEWAVSFLDERDRNILRLHYVDQLSMGTVAECTHYTERQAWNIERKCIKIIAEFRNTRWIS